MGIATETGDMTRDGIGVGTGPPPVVVVVEDDIGTLGLLADVAKESGWEARTCRSLWQLERALDAVDPSLVILDDELPDGRGGDEAIHLRTDPETSDMPVVVCTAAGPSRLAELRDAVPIVTKPFTIGQIERVLDAALRHRRRRLASGTAG